VLHVAASAPAGARHLGAVRHLLTLGATCRRYSTAWRGPTPATV